MNRYLSWYAIIVIILLMLCVLLVCLGCYLYRDLEVQLGFAWHRYWYTTYHGE